MDYNPFLGNNFHDHQLSKIPCYKNEITDVKALMVVT